MKFYTTLLYFNLLFFATGMAQEATNTTLPPGLEIGVHGGHFFSNGNIDSKPGFGAGVHLRKSLDYIFSLRLDITGGQLKGEDDGNVRNYSTDWISGALQGVVSLNNLKWSPNERKTNIYLLGGLGVTQFSGDLTLNGVEEEIEKKSQFHFETGVGVSFKINNKMNIGIEHKIFLVTSEDADFIDGVPTFDGAPDRFTFRDVPNYTNIRLNFNLGKSSEKTPPLYWLNPMESANGDIQLLKDSRVTLADDDGDGIINQLDEEQDTPSGANVNPKGIATDGDKDGVPDYLDKEPFSPAETPVNEEGVAQQPDIMEEVEKMLAKKLADFEPKKEETTATNNGGAGYLPSVYFGKSSANIRNKDFGILANVARVMSANKAMKFVVTGHTDQSGGETFNIDLSYNRAKAVLDFLVKSGVDRAQLILQYKGKKEPLVEGEATVNRRVGFRVANGDSEMAAPSTQN